MKAVGELLLPAWRRPWVGVALIAVALLVLPFVLASAGTAWVRITNLAILFVLLSLGLNIVVGFAGLLDLGYIAFYAVGAYVYALLASPHFGLHWPFWAILPVGAALVRCARAAGTAGQAQATGCNRRSAPTARDAQSGDTR